MVSGTEWLLVMGLLVLTGGVTAYFAERRGRDFLGWFCVGFFFGLLGLVLLFLLPKHPVEVVEGHGGEEGTGVCEPINLGSGPVFHTVRDRQWYYLSGEEEQRGPCSFARLYEAWQEGALSFETYVWAEGMADWKSIKELPMLREELETTQS